MEDTDASLAKGKTSVLSDLSVIARRKRMEIRKFKMLASATQLNDSLSLESSVFCLKRPRLGQQTVMECIDSASETCELNSVSSILHTEEGKFLPVSKGREASMLNDFGLPRHKSLPPMNLLVCKAQQSGPDTGIDRGPYGESKGHSAGLQPRTSEQQIVDTSSAEAIGSIAPTKAPSSMVDVTKSLENESLDANHGGLPPCQALLVNGLTPLNPSLGSSDVEMTDVANQSPAREAVGTSASQNIDSLHHALHDSKFPPSGKLLVCGRRREMEDTAMIAPSFTQLRCDAAGSCLCDGGVEDLPLCNVHFFGVYDGHGGSQASNYCMENLHHALAKELSIMRGDEGKLLEWSFSLSAWERAMVSCFSKIDRDVGGVCPNGVCDDVDNTAICCNNSIAPENVGTTAVVAVVSPCQIVVANCGDSRAVLSRGGMAMPLSRDHKPQRDDECSRIEAAGGRIIDWDGHRVGGFLALSRAIGDRYLKRYVISKPEVACLQRTKEDECLILASDGLWDVITNDTACEIARKCLHSTRKMRATGTFALGDDPACAVVAAMLIKLAYGREDIQCWNQSCVCILGTPALRSASHTAQYLLYYAEQTICLHYLGEKGVRPNNH